jgi:hypothetical protein
MTYPSHSTTRSRSPVGVLRRRQDAKWDLQRGQRPGSRDGLLGTLTSDNMFARLSDIELRVIPSRSSSREAERVSSDSSHPRAGRFMSLEIPRAICHLRRLRRLPAHGVPCPQGPARRSPPLPPTPTSTSTSPSPSNALSYKTGWAAQIECNSRVGRVRQGKQSRIYPPGVHRLDEH